MKPMNDMEKMFYKQLNYRVTFNRHYTDAVLLQHAFRFIPFEELKVKATLRFSLLDDSQTEVSLEDCILLELLHWFKHSFFTWFDAPRCGSCNIIAENREVRQPSLADIMAGATNVEHFQCPKCQAAFQFPRYNHPKKLLQTRTGRCGEWANCFTLFCHALEYDARIVYDWADHVWTEVYSQARNKWVHCDPCENAYDKPLMYELGWKKELSYVIAFSPTEIQDVTWRYTANFDAVMSRRTKCREEFVLTCIRNFQSKLEEKLDKDEKTTLRYRRLMELADFLTPAMLVGDSYEGRSSGSLAWRLARGEIGELPEQSGYTFRLTQEEMGRKRFSVGYSCADDKYVRSSSGLTEVIGWSTCVFSHSNVFRKVEKDWKMVYLTRTEGSSVGTVTWKFDFDGCDLVISELRLRLHSETFENGKVTWSVLPNSDVNDQKVYSSDRVRSLQTGDFRGCTSFLLSAELTEGTGSNAWQHSQLFRQSLDSQAHPFELDVFFERKFNETIED